MDEINYLYATYTDDTDRHEYDLRYLGKIMEPRITASFFGVRRSPSHVMSDPRPVNIKDYDGAFISHLDNLSPRYKMVDFLDITIKHFFNPTILIETSF